MVSLAAEESRNGWAILCDGWELRKDGPFYSDWRDFKWERYVGDGGSVSKFLCLESTERTDQRLSGSMAICKFPDGSHQSNGFVAALDQSLHMNYVMQM